MQYTPHYNLNLPEGTDIVNPLIQDNPNYSAIDAALYANKQRVIGTATHTKTGTNHSIVLADSDIPVFRFIATGDYAIGDTFSVDGVTVTPRVADGSSLPAGAFKINSTVEAILDGTILNLINVSSAISAADVSYNNSLSGLSADDVQDAIDELSGKTAKVNRLTYTVTTAALANAIGGNEGQFNLSLMSGYSPAIEARTIAHNVISTFCTGDPRYLAVVSIASNGVVIVNASLPADYEIIIEEIYI